MSSVSIATTARLCVGLMLIASVASCTGEKAEPADTSAAAATPAASPPWQSPVHNIAAATIATALGNPVKWPQPPGQGDRRCTGTQACDNPGSTVRVKVNVWAEANAMNVAFGSVGPTDAILIGKLKNLGGQKSRAYNLAPGRDHALYLVDSLGTPYYEIWEVHGADKDRVAAGKVTECGHTRSWRYSFAVFATCETSPTEHLTPGPGGFFTWANSGAVASHDGPAWFTCTSGCCTADVQ